MKKKMKFSTRRERNKKSAHRSRWRRHHSRKFFEDYFASHGIEVKLPQRVSIADMIAQGKLSKDATRHQRNKLSAKLYRDNKRECLRILREKYESLGNITPNVFLTPPKVGNRKHA